MRRARGRPRADPSRPSRPQLLATTGRGDRGCEAPSSAGRPPAPNGSPRPVEAPPIREIPAYSRFLRRTARIALFGDEAGSALRLQLLGDALPESDGIFHGCLGLTASCQPFRAIECSYTRIKLEG